MEQDRGRGRRSAPASGKGREGWEIGTRARVGLGSLESVGNPGPWALRPVLLEAELGWGHLHFLLVLFCSLQTLKKLPESFRPRGDFWWKQTAGKQ